MKNLEKKIIRKVYSLETQNTLADVVIKIVSIIFFGIAALIIGMVIGDIYKEQNTFDVLELFKEDFEIVSQYFFEVTVTFYEESPKLLLVFAVLFLTITFYLVYIFVKNLSKIRNKIKAIIDYWSRKHKN